MQIYGIARSSKPVSSVKKKLIADMNWNKNKLSLDRLES
jgi:hypothetical protein